MTQFKPFEIPDLLEVGPRIFCDNRGFFSETWNESTFEAEGVTVKWVQEKQSWSFAEGTVRGFHFQVPSFAQAKLKRVTRGAIFDLAVDIRKGSPTYGKWVGISVSADRWNQLFVPIGFAHGFMTTAPDTEVIYKVSAPYSPAHEEAIFWDDPALGIRWPRVDQVVLSEKDKVAPPFARYVSHFEWKKD